jgi:hypothetical protein
MERSTRLTSANQEKQEEDATMTARLYYLGLGIDAILLALARGLRARGAPVAATVLVWLPALPFGLMLALWGGLAVVFVLFGR